MVKFDLSNGLAGRGTKVSQLHRRKILGAVLLFSMLLVLVSTVNPVNADTPDTYQFMTQWGTHGSGDGQLNSPQGVAVDDLGNVYVADSYNHRIQKFSSSGVYLTQWGSEGSGNGQFNLPLGVAVDVAGNVYVPDYYNNRVQKFSSSGVYLTQWGSEGSGNGQFRSPSGVAVDGAGNVYVSDLFNGRVQRFDSSGNFLLKMGNGYLMGPVGVAVDDLGNVYVNDPGCVKKFDSSGVYITQFGIFGNGGYGFNNPCGVSVDGEGNVYVTDLWEDCVKKFDSSGVYITQFSTYGSDGQSLSIFGIAVDDAGIIYVTVSDYSNWWDGFPYQNTIDCVQKFYLEWSCSLTATSGSYYDVSVFGIHGGSTTGFDQASDMIDIPAPPAGVVSYFIGSDQMSLSTNFVQSSTDNIWSYRVESVGSSGSMQLTWSADSIASVPKDYFVLLLNSNGIAIADMRKTTQYSFAATSDVTYSFSVVVLFAQTVSLNLNTGWNLVSFPVLPSDASFASIFSGKGYYQVLSWTGTSYAASMNVETGKSYWVLVLSPTSLSLTGAPMVSYGVDLQSGWSMIGGVYGKTVSGGSIFSGYYQLASWNGAAYIDSKSVGIEPCKGYWALVLTPTHVTVS